MHWANGIVLVYDVCDRHSFHSMQKLLQQLTLIRLTFCPVLLIGNKQDIVTGRKVETSEGRVTSAKFKAHFCEVSSLTDGLHFLSLITCERRQEVAAASADLSDVCQ